MIKELRRLQDAQSLSGQELKIFREECQREFETLFKARRDEPNQEKGQDPPTSLKKEMQAIQYMGEETRGLLTQMKEEFDDIRDLKMEVRHQKEMGESASVRTQDITNAVMEGQDRIKETLNSLEQRLLEMEERTETEELEDRVDSMIDVMRKCSGRLNLLEEEQEERKEQAKRTPMGSDPVRKTRTGANEGYAGRLRTVPEERDEEERHPETPPRRTGRMWDQEGDPGERRHEDSRLPRPRNLQMGEEGRPNPRNGRDATGFHTPGQELPPLTRNPGMSPEQHGGYAKTHEGGDHVRVCAAQVRGGTADGGGETHQWKYLTEYSPLVLEATEIWIRGETLDRWLETVTMESEVVSRHYSRYAKRTIDTAKRLHEQYQSNPGRTLTFSALPPEEEEMEARFALKLSKAIPNAVRAEAEALRQEGGNHMMLQTYPYRSLATLLAAMDYALPGGATEQRSLLNYIRNPGTATSAEEATAKMRQWRRARARARTMQLPDVGGLETMDGLVGIVKQLESKHANLQFKVRTILADPMATRPDENYIMEVEKILTRELRMLSAEEGMGRVTQEIEEPRSLFQIQTQQVGTATTTNQPAGKGSAKEDEKTKDAPPGLKAKGGGKGKGKTKNPELFEACKKKGFCFAYNQDRCSLTNDECKYEHKKVPPEEVPKPKPKEEAVADTAAAADEKNPSCATNKRSTTQEPTEDFTPRID